MNIPNEKRSCLQEILLDEHIELLLHAVMRLTQIMGESARNISLARKETCPQVPGPRSSACAPAWAAGADILLKLP